MKTRFALSLFLVFFSHVVKAETCLSVDGLQFEAISTNTLLVSKNGQNLATLTIGRSLPKGNLIFRFFTPTICDRLQNDKLHINGELYSIQDISKFK